VNRLRAGEWVAAAGSVGLFVVLFFDWLGAGVAGVPAPPRSQGAGLGESLQQLHLFIGPVTGWSALGWFMDLLLCVAILGGLSLSYMTVKRTSPAWPVGAAVLTVGIGTVIALALTLRLLDLAGDSHLGPVKIAVGVQLPAYLGLFFTLLIPVGGFMSLKDERTDSPEARAYQPPPARTAPGS
jgi:hypothetical protein